MLERMPQMANLISVEVIATKIKELRGKKVMFDADLARLYGVTTKALNQAVRRNIERFPEDFMFRLTWEEARSLRSQSVTLKKEGEIGSSKRGKHIKYLPYAFTEQGVAMLSSVLKSKRAIQVNILIMRAFVKIKELLLTHKELALKLEALERKYANHDTKIKAIFKVIKQLLKPPKPQERRIIGFHR
jgi:hypothetical protein